MYQRWLSVGAVRIASKNCSLLCSARRCPCLLRPAVCVAVPAKPLQITARRKVSFDSGDVKALTVWRDVKEMGSSPKAALMLGFSGLIPFVAAPCVMIAAGFYMPAVVDAQIKYGAVILSFLGGPRWGLTLPEEATEPADWKNMGYGVVLPLVAWVSILLPSEALSLLTLITALTAAGYFDLAWTGYPSWYKGLRSVLSLIVVLSLWTTVILKVVLKKQNDAVKAETPAESENTEQQ